MQSSTDGQTFVFFGIVGSGKGTQVKLLQEYLEQKDNKEVVYIGTGEIFRKLVAGTSADSEFVKNLLLEGKLVPDDFTNKKVVELLQTQSGLATKHLIFDGYPRTVPQSKLFINLMGEYQREKVDIIYIELSQAEAMRRNLLRGRHDDTEEGLKKRFDEYVNNVVPAINFFVDKPDYKIHTINGEQSIEAVHQEIISKLYE